MRALKPSPPTFDEFDTLTASKLKLKSYISKKLGSTVTVTEVELPLQVRVKAVRWVIVCCEVPESALESVPAAVEERVQVLMPPPLALQVSRVLPSLRTRVGLIFRETLGDDPIHWDEPLCFLHEVTHYYVRNLRLIGSILGISFLAQGAGLTSFVLFGMALKVQIPLVGYLILVPLGLMVTAIPVAPAGLGVGQVAFLSLFHMVGTSQGANLYTLYSASYVLINLSGAFLYLSSQVPSPLPPSVNPAKIHKE